MCFLLFSIKGNIHVSVYATLHEFLFDIISHRFFIPFHRSPIALTNKYHPGTHLNPGHFHKEEYDISTLSYMIDKVQK